MTRASIVQRLLDKKQITAEEAVVLLNEEKKDTTYYPYSPGVFFSGPNWTGNPGPYCGTATSGSGAMQDNWEYPDTKFTPPSDN